MGRLRFAMVCASNMNRSMEAHNVLHQAGLTVSSFGLGRHVKLPGATRVRVCDARMSRFIRPVVANSSMRGARRPPHACRPRGGQAQRLRVRDPV